jgi:hypothetical protein
VTFALSAGFSAVPEWVDATWGRWGPSVAWALSRRSGGVSVSVAELVIAAFLLRQIVGGTLAVRDVARGRRRWRNAFACGALRVAQDAGIVVGAFYFLWGFQYSRSRVEARLDWPAASDVSVDFVADLAHEMVDAANVAYLAIHGVDDAGEPTTIEDFERLDASIDAGWVRVAKLLDIEGAPRTRTYGPVKRLFASPLLDRLGLSGFFFPFTGEANVNRGVPAVAMAQVIAHEKAHQRGINPEDEANFFGFLAAELSQSSLSTYSARVFAQRQLLTTLYYRDPERMKALVEMRLPGVQRDVDDLRAYWARHRGPARAVSQTMNDAFLRSNRVEGGVASYGRSVELLVSFAQTRGGRLLREPSPAQR